MKKKIAYSGLGLLFIFALTFGTYKLMNARSYQLFGSIISHIETQAKVVALTFDGGPTKNVNAIINFIR